MIKKAIANWVFENMSFPKGCISGNEMSWMWKGNCPACIRKPIKSLNNYEYIERYPARNYIHIGDVTVCLCDIHYERLKEKMQKDEWDREDSFLRNPREREMWINS